MHRATYHSALSVFDSGPEVIVAGWLMVSRDATGDNGDHVRAEGIQLQSRFSASQEVPSTLVEVDAHA